jgi:antitoxin (DNA-binding transcriptional repressor) of toxin-antitoxin stability system
MKAVGVKALKAALSEYLRLVKAGENILITERDEVVAELRGVRRQALHRSSLEEWLEGLAEEAEATLRSQERYPDLAPLKAALPEGLSSQAILDSLREEG